MAKRHNVLYSVVLVALFMLGCESTSQDPPANNPPPDQSIVPSTNPDEYAWEALTPAEGSLVMVEKETGSTFNLRGEAIAGPLAADKRLLRQVPGVNMFWFAWSVFFPGSDVWGRTERVRAAELPEDKSGVRACGGGKDCIPSLPNTGPPEGPLAWVTPDAPEARYLLESDLILGVFRDGVARAYPHNILWWHEIANDQIGDQRFSVTFCPLTGSGAVFAVDKEGDTFGVSGKLFDSNLIMYDHNTDSLWPQLWMGPVAGDQARSGVWLKQLPLSEMTWKRWKALHPETLVLSEQTGSSRNYTSYPYGAYRTDNSNTFRVTDPLPDPMYPNKAMTFGLIDRAKGAAKAYVHTDLEAQGDRVVLNETFDGKAIVVVFEKESKLVLAFESPISTKTGKPLTFEAAAFQP